MVLSQVCGDMFLAPVKSIKVRVVMESPWYSGAACHAKNKMGCYRRVCSEGLYYQNMTFYSYVACVTANVQIFNCLSSRYLLTCSTFCNQT